MTWVRLDDKRALNAKLRKAGLAARGLDEAAICWTAHEELDGFISTQDVEMLAIAHGCRKWRPLADLLVAVGRWESVNSGFIVKDFLEFNPSKADNEAKRMSKVEAGRRGGVRSGTVRRASSKNEAGASDVLLPGANPVPSRPLTTYVDVSNDHLVRSADA